MRWIVFCFMVSLHWVSFGQNNTESPLCIDFPQASTLPDTSRQTVQTFLAKQYPATQYGQFVLTNVKNSPIGQHYTWQQLAAQTPIYQQFIKINISHSGQILSVMRQCQAISNANIIQEEIDTNLARRYIAAQQAKCSQPIDFETQKMLYWDNNALVSGLWLRYGSLSSEIEAAEVLLNNKGQIIDLVSLHEKKHAQHITADPPHPTKDSTVTLAIFRPDPLCTAQVSYGTPYKDNNDADCPELTAQRMMVSAKVLYRNDSFLLASPFCKIKEFDAPEKPVCFSLTPDFVYTRSNDNFEQVNAYYHVNQYQMHVQELGFNNLVNRPIKVDANALNGADQSMYSGFSDALYFGEGGVDDAEDADNIWHEYTHAVSRDAAPNTNTGTERQTIEEANADFMAASYSASVSSFGTGEVFNWDGHNEFWAGRSVSGTRTYSQRVGQKYADAEIWSSPLMLIRALIGRDASEKLLLTSMFSYAPSLQMRDAANLFLQANTLLRGGADSLAIRQIFANRKILPVVTSVRNCAELKSYFQLEQNQTSLFCLKDMGTVQLSLHTLTGQTLWENSWRSQAESRFILPQNNSQAAGLYVLKLQTAEGLAACWKVLR
ncbi:hypothetical protein SAMN05421780_10552 [Flexibacter flexilis DSM 6793]|uniref:FTP domain-containing protein n=1 Tax=Flexibacter flexilis DSM 6793 TaxID=927664 RepID=A0A1I1IVL1_9BACT|nr:hypothetical protein [Flexibacter flexilis]SFC38358.1 hypothetical protein SAMN05421780_10552 [Flexibacter flexilis DSM 6793]